MARARKFSLQYCLGDVNACKPRPHVVCTFRGSAYPIGLPIFSPWYDGKYVQGAYTRHSPIIVIETSVNESEAIVILEQELNGISCSTQ